ncbi:MAG: hypothetical protein JXR78_10015, partial [Victivallales bacterium]|nr:hypothetical protein [Victivallales bacterium]
MKKYFAGAILLGSITVLAGQRLSFSDCGMRLVGSADMKKDLSLSTTDIPNVLEDIPGKGHKGIKLTWKQDCFINGETRLNKNIMTPFDSFQKAKFTLRMRVPETINPPHILLRFEDAESEIFQILPAGKPTKSEVPGLQQMTYYIESSKLESSWGKKVNREIDWPLNFIGLFFV